MASLDSLEGYAVSFLLSVVGLSLGLISNTTLGDVAAVISIVGIIGSLKLILGKRPAYNSQDP